MVDCHHENAPVRTVVVHVTQPHDQRIDRRTVWGNPFYIGHHGTRDEVLRKFEALMRERLKSTRWREAVWEELRGRRLGCHCKEPGNPQPCHGDVYVKLLDEMELGLL